MKITIEEHGYVFSREWPEDELDTMRPEADDAIDAALYLLALIYSRTEVEESARKWKF